MHPSRASTKIVLKPPEPMELGTAEKGVKLKASESPFYSMT